MWSRMSRAVCGLCFLMTSGWAGAQPAETYTVAITIDDVPWASLGQGPQPPDVLEATDRLLAHLTTRKVPAVAYVNCDALTEGEPVLRKWLAVGMEIGNHHASHANINKVEEAAYMEGVRSCDARLRQIVGGPVATYRFPYLFNGEGAAKRDRVQAALTGEFGYQIARVSADNYEWLLARHYGEARAAGDEGRAAEVADYYVAHMVASMQHARQHAKEKLGRDVAHILLLHANTLGADHLGRVLDALIEDGAVFVPVQTALADPVYSRPNVFEGWGGVSWLYRIEPLTTETPWSNAALKEIRHRFGGG